MRGVGGGVTAGGGAEGRWVRREGRAGMLQLWDGGGAAG